MNFHSSMAVSNPPLSTQRLSSLTSLRFVAAALIVEAHSHEYFHLPKPESYFAVTQSVSFFFVLSGFIMAYNYDVENRKPWRDFYVARFARIWPLHIFALLLYLIVSPSPFGPATDGWTRISTLAANVTLLQSWVPVREFVFSYNGPAWSLSTEFGFYLAFPLILVRRRYSELQWGALYTSIVLVAVFIVLCVYFDITLLGPPWGLSLVGIILANPLARLLEFVIGVLVCGVYRKYRDRHLKPSWILPEVFVIALAVASMWMCAYDHVVQIGNQTIQAYVTLAGSAPAFALLILVFAFQKGPISNFLGWPIFVFLGEVSFAVYLVHVPALRVVESWPILPPDEFGGLALYCLFVLAAAIGLHKLVETPARRWVVSLNRRQKEARANDKNPAMIS